MTITIELEADQEARLRQEAAREGMSVREYVGRLLQRYLAQTTVPGGATESELLRQTGVGLTETEWDEYHRLIEERHAEALSAAGQSRLIELTDDIEQANARRLAALVELAELRGVSLEVLIDTLDIRSPGYG